LLGLSLLAASRALEASAPTQAAIQVDPARVQIQPPAPVFVATERIVATHLPDQRLQATVPDLVSPTALRWLVAAQANRFGPVGRDVECMAKVVYHEAANQALRGQLAVAQVIMNRASDGAKFPADVCAVVKQPGQFFGAAHYVVPSSDTKRWRTALAISALALNAHLQQVAPGALFFHATFVRPGWSWRRQRVAQIGDQIFYR
jgi:N-acetylmuramoyl-L-alanine amidase